MSDSNNDNNNGNDVDAQQLVGKRVGAVLSMSPETCVMFGYGVYEGDFVFGDDDDSPVGPMADLVRGMPEEERPKNPRIRLDDGSIVWGCECWWGAEEIVRARAKRSRLVVPVTVAEVREQHIKAHGPRIAYTKEDFEREMAALNSEAESKGDE